jgi:hypothetical protein
MLAPDLDLEDRAPVWDSMQQFWMDTDPALLLPGVIDACADSKYSLAELEEIYWNEVRPAVSFNLWMLPAPEWVGFEIHWLTERILRRHRAGKRLPRKWLHPYAHAWWRKLCRGVLEARSRRQS